MLILRLSQVAWLPYFLADSLNVLRQLKDLFRINSWRVQRNESVFFPEKCEYELHGSYMPSITSSSPLDVIVLPFAHRSRFYFHSPYESSQSFVYLSTCAWVQYLFLDFCGWQVVVNLSTSPPSFTCGSFIMGSFNFICWQARFQPVGRCSLQDERGWPPTLRGWLKINSSGVNRLCSTRQMT